LLSDPTSNFKPQAITNIKITTKITNEFKISEILAVNGKSGELGTLKIGSLDGMESKNEMTSQKEKRTDVKIGPERIFGTSLVPKGHFPPGRSH